MSYKESSSNLRMTLPPTYSPELSYGDTWLHRSQGIFSFEQSYALIKIEILIQLMKKNTNIRGQLAVFTTMLLINNVAHILNI